jgi:hypothetical protein
LQLRSGHSESETKKLLSKLVDHVSDLKYKLTYEDDCTLVVCLANCKRFKKDFRVVSTAMSLWMAIAKPDFLKGKLARKNKKKEPPVELVTQTLHVLEHRSSVLVEDQPVQFCTIDRQKFHKFVNQDGAKGFSRQGIRKDTTPFRCGIIDFRNILSSVARSSIESPFYRDFISAFEKFRLPAYQECPVWIWILDSRKKAQVSHLVDTKRMTFRVVESVYIPHQLEQQVHNEDPEKLEGSTITVFILLLKESIDNN